MKKREKWQETNGLDEEEEEVVVEEEEEEEGRHIASHCRLFRQQ